MLWGCRRGLLELDIVLRDFIAKRYAVLTEQDAVAFMHLLDHGDNDLWDLVTGRMNSDDAAEQQVLEMLKQQRMATAD